MPRWKDFDIGLIKQNDGDILGDLDLEAIKNSLENIFSTSPGSRRMLPDFAMPMTTLLFEPIDEITANRIGSLLLGAIERWDDRVQVSNIHVEARPDESQYRIRLSFTLKNSETTEVMNFILSTR